MKTIRIASRMSKLYYKTICIWFKLIIISRISNRIYNRQYVYFLYYVYSIFKCNQVYVFCYATKFTL